MRAQTLLPHRGLEAGYEGEDEGWTKVIIDSAKGACADYVRCRKAGKSTTSAGSVTVGLMCIVKMSTRVVLLLSSPS